MDSLDYAHKLEDWQDRRAWAKEAITLIDRIGIKEGDSVLDVGTGPGKMLKFLRYRYGAAAFGVEPNAYLRTALMQSRSRFKVVPSLAEAAPLVPQGFDAVILSHVLGHADRPYELLYGAWGLLAKGGKLGIVIPNTLYDRCMAIPNWFTGYESDPTLKHNITEEELVSWCTGLVCREVQVRAGLMREAFKLKMEIFHMGEPPVWLPTRMAPACLLSRTVVIVTK